MQRRIPYHHFNGDFPNYILEHIYFHIIIDNFDYNYFIIDVINDDVNCYVFHYFIIDIINDDVNCYVFHYFIHNILDYHVSELNHVYINLHYYLNEYDIHVNDIYNTYRNNDLVLNQHFNRPSNNHYPTFDNSSYNHNVIIYRDKHQLLNNYHSNNDLNLNEFYDRSCDNSNYYCFWRRNKSTTLNHYTSCYDDLFKVYDVFDSSQDDNPTQTNNHCHNNESFGDNNLSTDDHNVV